MSALKRHLFSVYVCVCVCLPLIHVISYSLSPRVSLHCAYLQLQPMTGVAAAVRRMRDEKWQAEQNKSSWIHTHMHTHMHTHLHFNDLKWTCRRMTVVFSPPVSHSKLCHFCLLWICYKCFREEVDRDDFLLKKWNMKSTMYLHISNQEKCYLSIKSAPTSPITVHSQLTMLCRRSRCQREPEDEREEETQEKRERRMAAVKVYGSSRGYVSAQEMHKARG